MRIIALFAVVIGLILSGPARSAERTLIVATAPVAGVYYPAGGALCRVVNAGRRQHGLHCLVESTDGSRDNLGRLQKGEVDFALVQSDWQYFVGHGGGDTLGTGIGAGEGGTVLRAVASLHPQPFTLVAAPGSGIEALEDIAGKRLNLGPVGSAQRASGEALIEAVGWSDADFAEIGELGSERQASALCAGEIDALLVSASHPNALVEAVTERCGARLVPIEGQGVDILLATWPFYTRAEIAGGLYRANPEPVPSFGLRATLVTSLETPEDAVYWTVRSLFEGLDAVRRQHPALAQLSAEDMVSRGNTLALHPGALRYYKERGWK